MTALVASSRSNAIPSVSPAITPSRARRGRSGSGFSGGGGRGGSGGGGAATAREGGRRDGVNNGRSRVNERESIVISHSGLPVGSGADDCFGLAASGTPSTVGVILVVRADCACAAEAPHVTTNAASAGKAGIHHVDRTLIEADFSLRTRENSVVSFKHAINLASFGHRRHLRWPKADCRTWLLLCFSASVPIQRPMAHPERL
jgi:hypothetical protein